MQYEKEILETLGARISTQEYINDRRLKDIEQLTNENAELKKRVEDLEKHNVNLIVENARLKNEALTGTQDKLTAGDGLIIEKNIAAERDGSDPEQRG